jgi:hypothetical protein
MANCDNLFREFNSELQVPKFKRDLITSSKNSQRENIKKYFKDQHPKYVPTFFIQGSTKMKNRIRTKDDTCDLDDGIYFKDNSENVTGTTLQEWVKDAVDSTTDATPKHKKKCITVDYKAEYNIDYPIFIFNKDKDAHPNLAIKGDKFKIDDPKEFVDEFNRVKDDEGQLVRVTRFLKAWCDNRRGCMPNGLSMTVLVMKHLQKTERDDVAMKYTLIAIENELKTEFKCVMPTTPYDNLFGEYDEKRKNNFMDNLASFIQDAKKAVDVEKNQLKASNHWQTHLGKLYFPDGIDEEEKMSSAVLLTGIIGTSKPYCAFE